MPHLDQFASAFLAIFESHRFDHVPEAPIDSLSIEQAYAVQQLVIDARVASGETLVGYKVGCTSRAIREQFGLSEPICGQLLSPHVHYGDATLNWHEFHRPAIEPELVLTIARDLVDEVGADEPLDHAVACVSPGIEVHHYDWWFGTPTVQELICSNGIHACLVVGDERHSPRDLNWDLEGVGLFKNGELAASGIGAEIMGGPMRSLRWLLNQRVRRGDPLRAGQLVIPGSAVRLVSVEPGAAVAACFTHIGRVETVFAAQTPDIPASG